MKQKYSFCSLITVNIDAPLTSWWFDFFYIRDYVSLIQLLLVNINKNKYYLAMLKAYGHNLDKRSSMRSLESRKIGSQSGSASAL